MQILLSKGLSLECTSVFVSVLHFVTSFLSCSFYFIAYLEGTMEGGETIV